MHLYVVTGVLVRPLSSLSRSIRSPSSRRHNMVLPRLGRCCDAIDAVDAGRPPWHAKMGTATSCARRYKSSSSWALRTHLNRRASSRSPMAHKMSYTFHLHARRKAVTPAHPARPLLFSIPQRTPHGTPPTQGKKLAKLIGAGLAFTQGSWFNVNAPLVHPVLTPLSGSC